MRVVPLCLLLLVLSLGTTGCPSGGGGSGGRDGGGGGGGGPDSLRVDVTPEDAQIVVRNSDDDVVALPDDGDQLDLDAGRYSVEVHKVRFRSSTRQVQVDGETTLSVDLQSEPAVQPLPCGPLRVSSANPRYFADDCGPLYLAGLHTWNNLIDMGTSQPPRAFDFGGYLAFLGTHQANLTRLWAWETPHPNDSETPLRDWAAPQAFLRVGPALDLDGLPRFDVRTYDESYFVRMRDRMRQFQSAGIYVIVMLFEGWSVQFSPGGQSHYFTRANNVNNIDHGGQTRIHTLAVSDIVSIQEAYARKVVDTVNDLDNVLYEIANEAVSESVNWQYHMIEFVESYERSKPKQHPVGMTFPISSPNSVLFNSPGDWVSPGGEDLTLATGNKVVISDNDHFLGSRSGDQVWYWKQFTNGKNTLFMDCYVAPDGLCDSSYAPAPGIRRALGATRRYARRMDLASARPRPELASSGFCLASNTELMVFVPDGGNVGVEVPASGDPLRVEWYDPTRDQVHSAGNVAGGGSRDFDPPFSGPAALFLFVPD